MLRVGGLTPLSTTDWPGMLAAVVFCQGCPWRCGYCHNPDLIPPRGEHEIVWEEIIALLRRRQGLLDGVVFSGGEPTLQGDLAEAMREVRALGFKIGLHSGGAYPDRLAAVLPLVDWVGLDIKAPFDAYARITAAAGSGGARPRKPGTGAGCGRRARDPHDRPPGAAGRCRCREDCP
jgi:pyruvate formate lyase activating enzyme